MAPRNSKSAKPTAADKQAAERLRKIWLKFRREHKITQEKIAELFGDVTQGAISQYFKGDLPLGASAVLRFAQIFGCSPLDIRDDLPELRTGSLPQMDPQAHELWLMWGRLDDSIKRYLLETARRADQQQRQAAPFIAPALQSKDRK